MKQPVRAVIIDDEPGCIANLTYHLDRYCPGIEVVATGASVQEARQLFATGAFDVAFLDIALSDDLVFTIPDKDFPPTIVFVTAYEQYALKAFRLDATDYLVKPLAKEDLVACYAKICRKLTGREELPLPGGAQVRDKKIILRQGDQVYIVRQKDVYCLEARGFYCMICCQVNNKLLSVLVSKPISRLEAEYDNLLFFRVHKSFLVNTGKISEIIKNDHLQVRLENNMLIPVAKRKAAAFLAYMNNNQPGL